MDTHVCLPHTHHGTLSKIRLHGVYYQTEEGRESDGAAREGTETDRKLVMWGRDGGNRRKIGLSMKIGIKSVYRAVRHLEKSSGKRDVTLRATHTLENCPYSQQVAIGYLLYKHSPVSTTVSQGSVHGILSRSRQHWEEGVLHPKYVVYLVKMLCLYPKHFFNCFYSQNKIQVLLRRIMKLVVLIKLSKDYKHYEQCSRRNISKILSNRSDKKLSLRV